MRVPTSLLCLALLACATARRPVGEIAVTPQHELLPATVLVHDATFRLEAARIVAAGAAAGTRFDLVAMDDGCLRGEADGAQVHICQAERAPGDGKWAYRWRGVGGTGVVSYAVELIEQGDKLHVATPRIDAELTLPQGATGDEIRRHPELLGAAFAYGLFPASSDPREKWVYEVKAR